MAVNNSLKPVNLFFEHNIATKKLGLILVNTKVEYNGKYLDWGSAIENGKDAEKLFRDTFGFDDVQVCTDLSKEAIIEKFNALQKKADDFESTYANLKKSKQTMLIGVVWVGHTWY